MLIALVLTLLTSTSAVARVPTPDAPQKAAIGSLPPSAPPLLGAQGEPGNWRAFRCSRYFIYRGKSIECDSDLGHDGENLRPILSQTPEALETLNQYQQTRKDAQKLRYVATAGLVMMATGIILGRTLAPNDRILTRNLLLGSGLAISAGSYFWGLTLVRKNEARLTEAAEIYNRAHPKDPLQIQVTTGVEF